eukprot:3599461-Prymnesium_polylepis.1
MRFGGSVQVVGHARSRLPWCCVELPLSRPTSAHRASRFNDRATGSLLRVGRQHHRTRPHSAARARAQARAPFLWCGHAHPAAASASYKIEGRPAGAFG